MNIYKQFLTLAIMLAATASVFAQQRIDISGTWQVALDSAVTSRNVCYTENISLPGNTDLAALGTANTLKPELTKPQLLRLTRRHAYVGVAWYKRTVDISEDMAHQPLTFSFERVMWKSELWIDGNKVGNAEESLVAPHVFELPVGLAAGKHTIELRIDNRKQHEITVDNLAHAYTNDTQVMWNGVLGAMTITAHKRIYLHDVQVYPDVNNMTVRVVANVENLTTKAVKTSLTVNVAGETKTIATTLKPGMQAVEISASLPCGSLLWSEFHPTLYDLTASVDGETKTVSFGMRTLKVEDGNLTINGNRIFLRGTLECCVFPLRGCPPTDEAGWQKMFFTAKEWGLNHLRFHSWCPPEAAFRVADKMGFYLQVELPNWSLKVNSDSATVRFLNNEYHRMMTYYGNHPSLCLVTCGNELQPDFKYLNAFVKEMKQTDARHLYSTTSFTFEKGHGGKPEPEDEFFVTQWTDNGWVRGQGVFDEDSPHFNRNYATATRDITVPLISHEIGQYSVYPNIKEIDKYTGTLDPLNFKAVRDDLVKKGLYSKAADYTAATGRFAYILYKEELERAMKTPRFNGYQLLGLMDFPGQGTALVGLIDAFWDSKGVCTPAEFRQACAPVVPLANFDKATYTADETFAATIDVANYTESNITNSDIMWNMTDDDGNTIATGTLHADCIAKGGNTHVGDITLPLTDVIKDARHITLHVSIDGTPWQNTWSVWGYPVSGSEKTEALKNEKVICTQDVEEALAQLKKGKTVLLSPKPANIKGMESKFLPVFWSPVHFPKQAGIMGILCNPQHKALSEFPTENHSDWQWWHLVKNAKVMNLTSLATHPEPIIEAIDNFTNNRRLGYVFEANVMKGRLLMSSIDLLSDNTGKPALSQLLYSLVKYMQSPDFRPAQAITADELKAFINDETPSNDSKKK